ncbi:hypothetical protein ASE98_23390 [Pseudomonas sp. Leaf48]|uniref:DNA-primase RepB domain-containing protein n=1 Tax=Pseudomonas sp. Leaf48 TaxID=1736221 RepID=UPI000724F27A|nr:DNA-primase RepB domain-containing protein [Pseudomonas sp. Leaf48]KQN50469.1 hypothetical protein ASE98_23390 [Pseudomonas sp. Leaf48]
MSGKTGDLNTFLDLLAEGLRPDERLTGSAFAGDPTKDNDNPKAARGRWKVRGLVRYSDGDWNFDGDAQMNRFVSFSAFHIDDDGQRRRWRRRKQNFAAGCALMVDDVGYLADAIAKAEKKNKQAIAAGEPGNYESSVKFDFAILDGWTPTALIETSEDNFQAWYVLDEPCRDRALFARLLDQFVTVRGGDKKCKDIAHVGRTPESKNCKDKYDADGKRGWQVRVKHLDGPRYSVEVLAHIYGLDLTVPYQRPWAHVSGKTMERQESYFKRCLNVLEAAGMVKGQRGEMIDIICPFIGDHSDRADTGTVLMEPSDTNGWTGAFDCKHSSCATNRDASGRRLDDSGRGWREYTDWVNERIIPQLNAANARLFALEFFDD